MQLIAQDDTEQMGDKLNEADGEEDPDPIVADDIDSVARAA